MATNILKYMANARFILLLLMFCMFSSFVIAQDSEFVLKLNQAYTLKNPCVDTNYDYCSNNTVCLLTILRPDYTDLVKNYTMANEYNYFSYNITAYVLSQEGKYKTDILCKDYTTNDSGLTSYFFEVNENGIETSVYGNTEIGVIIAVGIIIFTLIILFIYLGWTFYKAVDMSFFLCFLFWYLAMLLPMFLLRMTSNLTLLNENIRGLLDTFFQLYIFFYGFMVLFLIIYFIALVMGYLDWKKKPGWMKREQV